MHWPPGQEPVLESYFGTWDAGLYLRLAVYGYQKGNLCCAFYPLWPMLIRCASWLAPGHLVLCGLVLANLFSIAGCYWFYRLVEQYDGEETAGSALILLLAFPGALFFNLIYTEPLFLMLVILFFRYLFKERYLASCACGFLLPLTRSIGILCIIPAGWYFVEKNWPVVRSDWRAGMRGAALKVGLPALGVLTGIGAYFTFMRVAAGNAWEGFDAQCNFGDGVHHPSIANIFDVPGFLRAAANVGSFHEMFDSFLDRWLFLMLLLALPGIWRLNKTLFFYALASGVVPAMSNWFFSYTRFFILCFPIFIVLAIRLRGRPMLFWYVTGLAGAVQVILLLRDINYYWAG